MTDVMGVAYDPDNPSYIGKDQYGETVYTQDGGDAVVYRASEVGINGQISGLTFQVVRSTKQRAASSMSFVKSFVHKIHVLIIRFLFR